MNKEIICPNCSQRIKILDTIGYDLYLENLKKEEREIERLKAIVEGTKENRNELQTRINKAIELLENSDIDLDDKLIIDLRDYSSYTLDTIINLLQGSGKE